MTAPLSGESRRDVPAPAVVVFDASPLIFIDRLGYLPALRDLYSEIIIPTAVSLELSGRLGTYGSHVPDLEWVKIREPQDHLLRPVLEGPPSIDSGEAEAIALALGEGGTIVVDDAGGRKRARRLGVSFTGTIGEVLALHRVGLNDPLRTIEEDFHSLRQAGMHITEDRLRLVLDAMREND